MAFGTLGNSETSGYAATVNAVKKYWANAHAGNVAGRNKPAVGSLRRGAVSGNDAVSSNAKAAKGYSMFTRAAQRKG
jgi:hypothetical protein